MNGRGHAWYLSLDSNQEKVYSTKTSYKSLMGEDEQSLLHNAWE